MNVEVKIEDCLIVNNELILKGYSLLRGLDINKIDRTLIIKNKETKEEIIIKLNSSLRTDLSYIYREDEINYDNCGFEDIRINLEEFGNGKWELFIKLKKSNKNIYYERVEVKLAQFKSKIRKNIVLDSKIKKIVRLNFDESTKLYFQIYDYDKIKYLKLRIREKEKNLKIIKRLLKEKKYSVAICIFLNKFFKNILLKKDVWLMGERPDTAQDNTYHLYKYIINNKKDINAVYVIDKKSKDYNAIKGLGTVIQFNSVLHTLYLLNCKYTINSYLEKANMYSDDYKVIIKYFDISKNKKIFLQHGVIGVSRVNHVLHKNRMNYDMFVVSSEFEKNHIIKEFGYSEKEVKVTGLARWDNLRETKEKKILLMPTWRSWIKSEEELLKSNYFKTYIDFVNDESLVKMLQKHNIRMTFYPHYQVQKVLSDVKIANPYVTIVKQGEQTVQELINSHSLLITDYSTVSFDFAYMYKPVIFYQFDYDEFYSKHYNEGPIDHKKDLFGLRVTNKEELLNILENNIYLKDMDKKYELNRNKYINGIENNICNHIFELIYLLTK
ncbi:CDP-glycerol glycerophosphotransferase family protein [Clostridium tertium]|uniref:CDP-glycerol glycerophosphotransferase family protein n=2 Tax=Clostridium tertium TaxID=1559 RepID=UPI000DD03CED|nr:CDP-glycerol glycerophosphotransferase family protein [Clostridium tertium]MDB1947912.1 CDP-glycerol glycerophosphotransferase family protein [Clostridium tertium]